jgi:tRNA(adenine34) deaminase
LRDRRLPHRAEVFAGVRADECAGLLDAFFAERRLSAGAGAGPSAGPHGEALAG